MSLPGTSRPFVSLADPRWQQALADPLGASAGPAFDLPLEAGLVSHLQALGGPDGAGNHARLAAAAEGELENLVGGDLLSLGKTKEDFRFFLAFAGEVMDRYGRLLAYFASGSAEYPGRAAVGLVQRVVARRGLGEPILHLAQHQPVPPGRIDYRGGSAAGWGGGSWLSAMGHCALRVRRLFRLGATRSGCTRETIRCGCCHLSCGSSPATNRRTGGWSTSPPTTTPWSCHRPTPRSRCWKTGCLSPPSPWEMQGANCLLVVVS